MKSFTNSIIQLSSRTFMRSSISSFSITELNFDYTWKHIYNDLYRYYSSSTHLSEPLVHDTEFESSSLIKQYQTIKKKYQDYIMFFRVGDFYEFFFQDAIRVSSVLNIALTSRGKYKGVSIPMCGIPYFNVDVYLKRVLKSGYKVAICEQLETRDEMKERQKDKKGVSVMKREVTRIITAGTITEDQYLTPQQSNLLASLYTINGDRYALTCADISTGDFYTKEFSSIKLSENLLTYDPKELLLPISLYNNPPQCIQFIKKQNQILSDYSSDPFNYVPSETKSNSKTNEIHNSEDEKLLKNEEIFHEDTSTMLNSNDLCVLVPQQEMEWNEIKYNNLMKLFFTKKTSMNIQNSSTIINDKQSNSIDNISINYSFSLLQRKSIVNLLSYIKDTQMGSLPHLTLSNSDSTSEMDIDQYTRESLDITKTRNGKRNGSLLDTIDYTVSPGGARLLRNYISFPSTSIELIQHRQEHVAFYKTNPLLQQSIRQELKSLSDVDRALQRIVLHRGGPRDLGMIRDFFYHCQNILKLYNKISNVCFPETINKFLNQYNSLFTLKCQELEELLQNSLSIDMLPSLVSQGHFIKPGYDKELDKLIQLHESINVTMKELESKYIRITGIQKLRILSNQKGEYYISIPTTKSSSLRDISKTNSIHFYLCKSLKSSERYKTIELNEIESNFYNSSSLISQKEIDIYQNICSSILSTSDDIKSLSVLLSQLDIYTTFSYISNKFNLIQPSINESSSLSIKEGRHLTLEQNLKRCIPPQPFVQNDTELRTKPLNTSIYLITGPNMGGKSTYIRQIAQICILAQIGCFVPASFATIGIVDKIFTRIGSSDDLYTNKSTFFLEMIETANILNTATSKSLVLVDEIGRGTGTQEGLSLSLSILIYILQELQCRCIFATHFHELPQLVKNIPSISQYAMQAITTDKDIYMTYKLIPGHIQDSHAFHVARMAGIPEKVLKNATTFYDSLKKQNHDISSLYTTLCSILNITQEKTINKITDSSIYNYQKNVPHTIKEKKTKDQLESIMLYLNSLDINNMTPVNAINCLQHLKDLSKTNKNS